VEDTDEDKIHKFEIATTLLHNLITNYSQIEGYIWASALNTIVVEFLIKSDISYETFRKIMEETVECFGSNFKR